MQIISGNGWLRSQENDTGDIADKRVSGCGLSQAMALPAVMISRMGNHVRLGQVAELRDLAPSLLVRIMDQLIDAGLLKRFADGNVRRAKSGP